MLHVRFFYVHICHNVEELICQNLLLLLLLQHLFLLLLLLSMFLLQFSLFELQLVLLHVELSSASLAIDSYYSVPGQVLIV